MAETERDPVLGNHFWLSIGDLVYKTFTSCSGFGNTSEVVEHVATDATGKAVKYKIPGDPSWDDITLVRGDTGNQDLWNWRKQILDGKVNEARKNGSIIVVSQDDEEISRWNFTNGWPSGWKRSDLDASSNAIATEEITITVESLELAP